MVKKKKPQTITFKSILRLAVFILIVFFLISWLNQEPSSEVAQSDPTLFIGETESSNVLGDVYDQLPEDSRQQLENLDQTEIGKFISNTSEYIKIQLDGFPQKQIKEIKKEIIRNISEDMIKSIDEN